MVAVTRAARGVCYGEMPSLGVSGPEWSLVVLELLGSGSEELEDKSGDFAWLLLGCLGRKLDVKASHSMSLSEILLLI